MRHPLLCYPSLHYCWGRCCPFYIRLCAILYCATPPYTTAGADAARFIYGYARSCTVLPLPTILLGQMLTVSYSVGCAILYCATPPYTTVGADVARFLYGCSANLYCPTPPLHCCRGRCCPFFIRLAARSSTVLPLSRALLLGQILLDFCFGTVGCANTSLCYLPTLHQG